MAKTRKTQHARSTNEVWRIFHFEKRYEMSEDSRAKRKTGLDYTKRFVGVNGGDEAVGYQQQMGMLLNGDGIESCVLEGLYGKLVNMSAALSRAKRGYLLDASDQPLASSQIAKLLNVPSPTMRKYIKRFESVGLLEYIELPEFDMSLNEPPEKKDNGKDGDSDTEKPPAKGRKGHSSGNFRENPEKSGKKGKPFKNYKYKQELLTGLNGKEKEERETLTGFSREEQSKADQNRAEQTTATADQKGQEPENPRNPKESEAGGATKHIVPTPPHSVSRAGPQAIGQIIKGRFPDHWLDADAEAFGWEIIEALGMPMNRDDENIRSEWGAFASWWSRVKHTAPAMLLNDLRSMAIGKAVWIHSGPKKPKHVRNPSAWWFNIMDKEMAHRGISLPPARASPQAKAHA